MQNIETHIVEEPYWLKALVERIDKCVTALNLMGPLGYRWLEPGTINNPNPAWIVAIYPTPNEAYGGGCDGQKLYPGFALDIGQLIEGFSQIKEVAWNNPTGYNGDLDGPEVSIKGLFIGEPVWLRVFHIPPSDEDPTLVVNIANGDFWEKRD